MFDKTNININCELILKYENHVCAPSRGEFMRTFDFRNTFVSRMISYFLIGEGHNRTFVCQHLVMLLQFGATCAHFAKRKVP